MRRVWMDRPVCRVVAFFDWRFVLLGFAWHSWRRGCEITLHLLPCAGLRITIERR